MKYLTDKERREIEEKFRSFVAELQPEQYENPIQIIQILWALCIYERRRLAGYRGTLGV